MNKPIKPYPIKASELADELKLTPSQLMRFRKEHGMFDKVSALTIEQSISIKEKLLKTRPITSENKNPRKKKKFKKAPISRKETQPEGVTYFKVDSIHIENYKSYEKIKYNCNHNFNLIIGENNIGKTSIFDAILLWKMAYLKLITTNKTFFKPVATDRDIILTHEDLTELRFADTQYIFNNHLKKCKIGFNLTSKEESFNLVISFERPVGDGAYLIISNNDQYEEFHKFQEYCTDKPFNIINAISTKLSRPIANIVRRESYLNSALVSYKSNTGYPFEVLRNKIINTMDTGSKKFSFLEDKLEKILGHSFQIKLKADSSRDRDLYISLTIQQNEGKGVDLSLVGSGVLNLLEILSSLYNKSEGANLVLLDEPDSHIHSDIQHKLIGILKDEIPNNQVFIISHNDKLIYSVDKSERFFIDQESKENGHLDSMEDRQVLKLKNDLSSFPSIIEKNEANRFLFVEDEYDYIYKIAWLKLNDISFNKDNLNDLFSLECNFIIRGLKGAGAVSGLLRSKNPEVFEGWKIIGLFDFDREGGENFNSLKKDKYWENNILGSKTSCHYRKRSDHPSWHALLLPVPDRISHLADLEYDNFASYVEIENLLPDHFLTGNNLIDTKKAAGTTYFKIKDSVKRSLWEKAIDLPKSDFLDFSPLFSTVDRLFCQSNESN